MYMLGVGETRSLNITESGKSTDRCAANVTRSGRNVHAVYLPHTVALLQVTIAVVTARLRSVDKIGLHNRLLELVVSLCQVEGWSAREGGTLYTDELRRGVSENSRLYGDHLLALFVQLINKSQCLSSPSLYVSEHQTGRTKRTYTVP